MQTSGTKWNCYCRGFVYVLLVSMLETLQIPNPSQDAAGHTTAGRYLTRHLVSTSVLGFEGAAASLALVACRLVIEEPAGLLDSVASRCCPGSLHRSEARHCTQENTDSSQNRSRRGILLGAHFWMHRPLNDSTPSKPISEDLEVFHPLRP